MNVLVAHIPHAVPVVFIWGMLLRFWLIQRRMGPAEIEGAGLGPSPVPSPPVAAVRPVSRRSRSVALRGLFALGPLLGALATGLVIYALNLGRGHAGQAAIWTHVGLSLLALLLVAYKVAEIGLTRLRESIGRQRALRSAGSAVLLALWVPLLVSGVLLLIFPSQSSFTAYSHLIASVWWTGLLLWHLRRYLAHATRTVLARPGPSTGVRTTPPGGRPAGAARSAARAGAGSSVAPTQSGLPRRGPQVGQLPASVGDFSSVDHDAAGEEPTAALCPRRGQRI